MKITPVIVRDSKIPDAVRVPRGQEAVRVRLVPRAHGAVLVPPALRDRSDQAEWPVPRVRKVLRACRGFQELRVLRAQPEQPVRPGLRALPARPVQPDQQDLRVPRGYRDSRELRVP